MLVVRDRASGRRAARAAACGANQSRTNVEPARRSRAARTRSSRRERVAQLALEHELVVLARLDAHQQAVERRRRRRRSRRSRSRAPGRASCPEPANGSSTRPPRRHVAREQRLDELRDELAEVRVEPVDVLRPLALGQVALRPRERRGRCAGRARPASSATRRSSPETETFLVPPAVRGSVFGNGQAERRGDVAADADRRLPGSPADAPHVGSSALGPALQALQRAVPRSGRRADASAGVRAARR